MTDFYAKARALVTAWVYDDGASVKTDSECAPLIDRVAAALKAAHNEAIERAAVRARIAQLEGSLADGRVRELKVPT